MRSVRGRTSYLSAAVVGACLALALTGCGTEQQPQNVGAESGAATPPRPTDPTDYKSYVKDQSTGSGAAVLRRSDTNNLDVDVLVKVSYRGGAVSPWLDDVEAQVGNKIEIEVTSDRAQKVTVEGHPEASQNVPADEPEDVEFTATQEGVTKVTLRPSGETLVTFAIKG